MKKALLRDLVNYFPHQAPDQVVRRTAYVKKAEKRKHIFPLTRRGFRIVLTAPVTVAGNERTFTKLKTVSTALQKAKFYVSDH